MVSLCYFVLKRRITEGRHPMKCQGKCFLRDYLFHVTFKSQPT